MPLDFGGMLWQVIAILIGIVAFALFLLWEFWVTPPISRKLRKAKWSKCPGISFIQKGGIVHLVKNNIELPEGVVINALGVAFKNVRPYISSEKWEKFTDDQKKQINSSLQVILNTPILAGLGKHVLFGSVESPFLGNLDTLALATPQPKPLEDRNEAIQKKVKKIIKKAKLGYNYSLFRVADLNIFKEVINKSVANRTLIDGLKTYVETKMLKKFGGDVMKIVVIALVMVGVIGTLGLVFWFLTQGGA